MLLIPFLLYFLVNPVPVHATSASPSDLASQYSLTTSTILPLPTSIQSNTDTQTFLINEWFLNRNRIQNGGPDLEFVSDPFPDGSSRTLPVLQVTYPEDSFSHDSGGAQFINMWNNTRGSVFNSMMLSYDLAFGENFDWVKGGKLPGIRGGNDTSGCSGGNEATGLDCFSVRLMWRADGVAEAYAYIPTPNDLCSERNIVCNSDFGISISRGAFGFVAGRWNRITILVQLNDPVNVANGNLQVYYNDLLLISQQNLQFRSSSAVSANGLYFSTFFGGNSEQLGERINDTHFL
ncbi:hypothetical protein VKT23_000688 [Stygiomarasmius scandens]|uniref:Polysaccharide lyase 14 domain-containing protein n=1 Tax=Marasmiellus scandens TaxID=2682957 RepID=A0ABR1K576_9AGAR